MFRSLSSKNFIFTKKKKKNKSFNRSIQYDLTAIFNFEIVNGFGNKNSLNLFDVNI